MFFNKMPEGPEVRNITDYLNANLSNLSLINVGWDADSRYHPDGPDQIELILSYLPAKMERVFCKGKQIFFQLISINQSKRFYFNSGLGMAGGWIVEKGTHSNLWLDFGQMIKSDDLSLLIKDHRIYFDDKRHFGKFAILLDDQSLQTRLAQIGPDLLSGEVTYPIWHSIINKHRKCSLVSFLMNQAYISGIGNYLKAEILYRAKLKPDRKVSSLSSTEMELLWKVSLQTIQESYQANGLTIKDYQDPLGKKGTFSIQIYGKSSDPFENPVITSKFSDGRTTHWVPSIQV